MRVRIYSLHPRLTTELFPEGNPLPFGFGVTVVTSILSDDGRYPLPIFQPKSRKHVRTFLPTDGGAIA